MVTSGKVDIIVSVMASFISCPFATAMPFAIARMTSATITNMIGAPYLALVGHAFAHSFGAAVQFVTLYHSSYFITHAVHACSCCCDSAKAASIKATMNGNSKRPSIFFPFIFIATEYITYATYALRGANTYRETHMYMCYVSLCFVSFFPISTAIAVWSCYYAINDDIFP